jgi:hypothetical protein
MSGVFEARQRSSQPGLPDFYWHYGPKLEKYTKLPQNIPNVHKIFQMAVKLTKYP